LGGKGSQNKRGSVKGNNGWKHTTIETLTDWVKLLDTFLRRGRNGTAAPSKF
jgi:hypothetical protein